MSHPSLPPPREPWYRQFQTLMPFRVQEVLLVSSAYDAFVLEEDGPLTERIFTSYSELKLSAAPRITHVSSIATARATLSERPFDLVVTVPRLEDGDAAALAAALTAEQKYGARGRGMAGHIPIVLLLFDEIDLQLFRGKVPKGIELAFLWTGHANSLIAVNKLIEDRYNVRHDVKAARVPVILVVEDELRAYSTFLTLLYPELMSHSHSLIREGTNDLHRVLRMRGRTKILLENDFEGAKARIDEFGDHILAVITDLRFPHGGKLDPQAGVAVVEELRRRGRDLPILLLSSENDLEEQARRLGTFWAVKRSAGFPTKLHHFLQEAL
ncbi:MAG: hypothetical protein AAGF12_31795, partial [Myxococcota bacterium]